MSETVAKTGGKITSKKQAIKFANMVSKLTQKSYDFRRKGNPDILPADLVDGRMASTVRLVQEGVEKQTLGLSLEEDGKAFVRRHEIDYLMKWKGPNGERVELHATENPAEPWLGAVSENGATFPVKVRPHEKHENVFFVYVGAPTE